MSTRHYWLAVACADHVAVGVAGGFMQVCHGKAAPLKRINPGDGVVYYSPSQKMAKPDGLQSFTACGDVLDGEPYQVVMHEDFQPYRRDVLWQSFNITPIRPLLNELSFTRGRKNWGYALRFGLIAITQDDWALITAA